MDPACAEATNGRVIGIFSALSSARLYAGGNRNSRKQEESCRRVPQDKPRREKRYSEVPAYGKITNRNPANVGRRQTVIVTSYAPVVAEFAIPILTEVERVSTLPWKE